jgi:hypothetical protein
MIWGILLDYCDESGYIYIGMVDRPTCHITFQHSPTVRTGSTANINSMFGWLMVDDWCWFVLREEYCWLVAGG